jgi:hypothetical protein
VTDALTLLSGDAQTFKEKVWASHVHLHRADPDDLVGLLSLDDVDQLITSSAMRTPQLRIAKDGAVLPASRFTTTGTIAGETLTGLVDPRKVLALFASGATVVLQGLHRYWPPLTRLVRDLELQLGHPCQANAYLTPPGSRGFAVHSDSHDVFVFQTHGTKLWEVHDEDGAHDVLLEPGLSMYLPTGTPHAASAQESTSLHVTLGINQVTWRHLLQQVTADLMADDSYAAHLPAGYLDNPEKVADGLAERLRMLADGLSAVNPHDVTEQRVRQFLTARTSRTRGSLVDLTRLDGIDDRSRLVRRPGVPCVLRDEQAGLVALLGDRELRMPARLRPALQHIAASATLQPADLEPWLDAESRLVLTRRLVREGLLQTTG